MDQTEPKYPEKLPYFSKPGTYTGWVAATRQPTGRSAMSVELRSEDENESHYHFAASSAAPDSNEQRAYARGLIDLCEALPIASALRANSRSTYVGHIVDLADQWRANGWRSSSGPVENVDLVKLYLKVRDERRLKVSHKHCPKKRSEHDKTLTRLHDEAHGLALDQ
ncbi:ribonuclease H family protein [Rhizobium ruizarguesonis]|uniref:hypothetical protein n=1 Tax=Rhizobium ruizarguesonis TaxID=2081791 RepID=UPI00102F7083|nr:hypothetical protein [Rhizobium ruizarguesonis]TBE09015.1 hypothetical protein ELH12_24705 [Rhizobium ruizarguesonis]TBE80172.1 hypothetical protein ELH01_24510 [Rhizobium ruizarguesonis]TBE89830.1 hypothetical protein ELG99_24700 [Rhizobium ruizarguesonis]